MPKAVAATNGFSAAALQNLISFNINISINRHWRILLTTEN